MPVRVTRGFQIPNGPNEKGTYRYDGLYYVTSVERVIGKSGFYICRFHLQSELIINDLQNKLQGSFKSDYKTPSTTTTTGTKYNRNVKLAENIKKIYDFKCQVCDVFLKKPSFGEKPEGIVESAHIQGLGKPHNGPDEIENMLALCPNHHAQFDAFSFYIEPETFNIVGLENYNNTKITISKKHKLDSQFLEYHKIEHQKVNQKYH